MNVSFFGRLTKAPGVKTNQTGTSYTTFTIATQVQAKGQDGKAKTLFVDVSAFGKQGDTIVKYFGKGSRIVIHGDIFDANARVGKNDGQPHIGVNVTMSGFDFVDTQAESAARRQSAPMQPQPPTQAPQMGYAPPMQTGAAPWAPPAYGAPQQGMAPMPPQQAPQGYAAAPY